MNYPPDSDVILVLCEDVRAEIGNKLSVLGWFTGGDITFPPDALKTLPVMMPSLCLVMLIRSGDGQFQLSAQLMSPSGARIDIAPVAVTKFPDFAAVNIVKLMNFAVEVGTYSVAIYLDKQIYSRTFPVRIAP